MLSGSGSIWRIGVGMGAEAVDRWMRVALEEARKAAREGEVPVGAVVVQEGELLARDHNRSIQRSDPTAHAEILVLRKAGELLSNYRLNGTDLFVTLEPCAMCAGALVWARVGRLVYAAADPKAGAVSSRVNLLKPGQFNHSPEVVAGVREAEARQLLQDFFSRLRTKRGARDGVASLRREMTVPGRRSEDVRAG